VTTYKGERTEVSAPLPDEDCAPQPQSYGMIAANFVKCAVRNLNFATGVTGAEGSSERSALPYLPNRSLGGAISVTRSRMSFLFGSGVSVISRGSSRAVQA
jgi:hypothetical protein